MDPSGREFEDFVPPHRLVREPPTHTLSVDLTEAGHRKEHIKVQLVHSNRRLIVRGERPVAGNRWSRFQLEFKLPDDCDVKGVQGRFEKGVLRVTMPGMTQEVVSEDAGHQQKPTDTAPAAASSGVQGGAERRDGDRAAPAPPPPAGGAEEVEKGEHTTKAQKQDADQQRVISSAKDGGRGVDDASEGGEATAAAPSRRQGYAFLHGRRKTASTVLGVVLVLISIGIYVKYSLEP